tara:strand:+ start:415 stop:4152 length:3738 start_codon:yes stop_codon:yes gene_type:complete
MSEQVTYEKLLKDDAFLNDAYHALRALGNNRLSNNRKEILDAFLTKRRYFDTNIVSTFNQADAIKDLNNLDKTSYINALNKIEKLPSAFGFSEGGAPMWKALKDYAIAGASDPTNLLSIIAGGLTLGAGGAAVWGAKEAAKQGVKQTLKAKVRALGNKSVLKSLAVEGTVAGAGGSTQAWKGQELDIDLGRRTNYNPLAIGAQGVAEGILSPAAGVLMNLTGTATKGLVKQADKLQGKITGRELADSQALAHHKELLARWILPQGGLDEVTARNLELSESAFKPIKERAETVSNSIDQAWRKDFSRLTGDNDADIILVNKAMEGNKNALQEVATRSPDMAKSLQDFFDLRKMVYDEVRDPSIQSSQFLKNIWKKNPNYVRDIYERYTLKARQPFEQWIKNPENANLISDFTKQAQNNIELGKQLGIFNSQGKQIVNDPDQIAKIIETEVKAQYLPDLRGKSKLGALKTKNKDLEPLLKKLYGVNANPAIRATETIMGIVEPVTDIKMAGSLADSLLNRGLAFKGATRIADAEKAGINLNTDRLVKLITKRDMKKFGKPVDEDSPFIIRGNLYSEALEDVYVPESLAKKIKVMTENQQFFSNNAVINTLAAHQGYLKKGKTVYNPFAHARNFLGMLQYTANSGNLRGIGDFAKYLATASSTEKQAFKNNINKLGLKGSAVELNQILNRISGAADDPNMLKKWVLGLSTMGVSGIERTKVGKGISRKLTDIYSQTDDLGKIMTFMSESNKARQVWKQMSDVGKEASRAKYIRDFGQPLDKQGKLLTGKALDNKVIEEMATQKTLNVIPVYSRIPKILERMRGLPLVGSFTAFPAENLRNKYKIMKLGAEEIQDGFESGNNALIKTGANRLMAQGTFAGLQSVGAYIYNRVMGTDKAEDMLRESLPEWQKYHALQIRPGEDGKLYYTDLSYLNPDQYVLDMIMPLMISAANGENINVELDKGFDSVINNMYKPFLDPSLSVQFGKYIKDYVFSDDPVKAASSLAKAYKTSEPGIYKVARELLGDLGAMSSLGKVGREFEFRTDPLYYDEKRKGFNDISDVAHKFRKWGINLGPMAPFNLSLKEQVFDPQKQMAFTVKTLLGESNSKFNSAKSDIRRKLQDSSLNFPVIELLEQYNEILEEQYVAQQKVADLAVAYKKYYGTNKTRELFNKDVIKSVGNLSDVEIKALFNNKFIAPEFKRKFWDDLEKTNPEYFKKVIPYKSKFNELHRFYDRRSLAEGLPDLEFKIKE